MTDVCSIATCRAKIELRGLVGEALEWVMGLRMVVARVTVAVEEATVVLVGVQATVLAMRRTASHIYTLTARYVQEAIQGWCSISTLTTAL